ncbi:hypothetical protein CBL_05554 [Carabus blaptoides fortunei]
MVMSKYTNTCCWWCRLMLPRRRDTAADDATATYVIQSSVLYAASICSQLGTEELMHNNELHPRGKLKLKDSTIPWLIGRRVCVPRTPQLDGYPNYIRSLLIIHSVGSRSRKAMQAEPIHCGRDLWPQVTQMPQSLSLIVCCDTHALTLPTSAIAITRCNRK